MGRWSPIVGYEGHYEVSDLGHVRSIDRIAWNGRAWHKLKGRFLKSHLDRDGRLSVILSKDNMPRRIRVHVLVARAFLGDPPIGYEVAHNDGVPTNNRLSNLRYDTHTGNQADKIIHGTHLYGETHGMAKLTEQNVKDIHALLNIGVYQKVVAKEFGVTQANISAIKRRINWAHL